MTTNEIYYSSFVYLLHRITNNLRFIYLEISKNPNVIILKCYYFTYPSDVEKEMIEDIGNDILTITDEYFVDKYEFINGDIAFDKIVTTDYLLYAIYEPGPSEDR